MYDAMAQAYHLSTPHHLYFFIVYYLIFCLLKQYLEGIVLLSNAAPHHFLLNKTLESNNT